MMSGMTRRLVRLVLLAGVLSLFACPVPVLAQSTDDIQSLRKAIDALRESQQRIEKDLEEIKTLLRGRAAAPREEDPRGTILSVAGEPSKGDKNARLVLVEFTDYQ
jgi:hypothetical protein